MKTIGIAGATFTVFALGAVTGAVGLVLYAMHSISKMEDPDMSLAWAGPFRPPTDDEWAKDLGLFS